MTSFSSAKVYLQVSNLRVPNDLLLDEVVLYPHPGGRYTFTAESRGKISIEGDVAEAQVERTSKDEYASAAFATTRVSDKEWTVRVKGVGSDLYFTPDTLTKPPRGDIDTAADMWFRLLWVDAPWTWPQLRAWIRHAMPLHGWIPCDPACHECRGSGGCPACLSTGKLYVGLSLPSTSQFSDCPACVDNPLKCSACIEHPLCCSSCRGAGWRPEVIERTFGS